MDKPKLLCVIGPTAAGKSELAVELAKKFDGEIISADSRQVYRGLDIGTGKVEGEWLSLLFDRNPEEQSDEGSLGKGETISLSRNPEKRSEEGSHDHWTSHPERPANWRGDEGLISGVKKLFFERIPSLLREKSRNINTSSRLRPSQMDSARTIFMYKTIPHYLIDEVNPNEQFSVADFKSKAEQVIKDILNRGKLPIICGGTMHWIDAVVFDQTFPEVEPNLELRQELQELTTEELFFKLQQLDPVRAQTIDFKNSRRLIRAIEIVTETGDPIPKQTNQSPFETIWIGINPGMEQLEQNIKKRLYQRFDKGMVKEVENLHGHGISWERLKRFGLEYEFIPQFLNGEITEQEMRNQSYFGERQYAKRQLTWWKRNREIQWFKTEGEALKNLSL